MKKFKRFLALSMTFASILTMTANGSLAADFGNIGYNVAVLPKYEDVGKYSFGLAAAKLDGKWGYIDTQGKVIVDFKYDYASAFNEGKAVVGTKETAVTDMGTESYFLMGFVDAKGNYTKFMADVYTDSSLTKKTYSQFKAGEWNIFQNTGENEQLNRTKEIVFNNGYALMSAYEGFQPVLFSKDGRELKPNLPNGFYIENGFYEGLAKIYKPMAEGEKTIFVDESGKTMLDLPRYTAYDKDGYVYKDVLEFKGDVAGAFVKNGQSQQFDFALINKGGKILFSGPYDRVMTKEDDKNSVINDRLIVLRSRETGFWGAVDRTGKTVAPFSFDKMRAYSEGLSAVFKNGKWGYADYMGNLVIEYQFDSVSDFHEGYAVAVKSSEAYCIDRNGKKISGSEKISYKTYTSNRLTENKIMMADAMTAIEENGKYGFGKIDYKAPLPKQGDLPNWALDEVSKAIENGLVPQYMQNQYNVSINRLDFSNLIIKAIEKATSKSIEEVLKEKTGKTLWEAQNSYPFKDTSDPNIIAASALGIIKGVGGNMFNPYGDIQREDAASLLTRASRLIFGDIKIENVTFNDDSAISSYAKQSVNYVAKLKIMTGTGENNFSPKAAYTREQAYLTICRLYETVKK